NPSSARAWICRGVEAAPEHAALYDRLAALAREGGAPLLLESLERVIETRSDRIPIAALLTAASLQRDCGEPQRALAHLERATERDPDSLAAVDALIELLSALGRHADLASALERAVALCAADPRAGAQRLARLGGLHESQLFDAEAALDAFERAHTL